MKKTWIIAGTLNLVTALIHTIAGHFELILPFMDLEMDIALKAILHACWHMVTVALFFSSLVFLYIGVKPLRYSSAQLALLLGVPYIAFSLVFIALSMAHGLFLFQWVLLLPIGILAIYGAKTA